MGEINELFVFICKSMYRNQIGTRQLSQKQAGGMYGRLQQGHSSIRNGHASARVKEQYDPSRSCIHPEALKQHSAIVKSNVLGLQAGYGIAVSRDDRQRDDTSFSFLSACWIGKCA